MVCYKIQISRINHLYIYTLEYTKGGEMPSDFLSRHVKVESLQVGHNSGRNMQYKNAISSKRFRSDLWLPYDVMPVFVNEIASRRASSGEDVENRCPVLVNELMDALHVSNYDFGT